MEPSSFTGGVSYVNTSSPRPASAVKWWRRRVQTAVGARQPAKPFDLLRWFSIASLVALVPVAAATAAIMSHYIADQVLQRDALLTAKFIQNCIAVESMELGGINLVPYLDPRVEPGAAVDRTALARGRREVFEHLETLPDALLTNIYARDRMIVWSTNKKLVGTYSRDDKELEEAFATSLEVARHSSSEISVRHDRQFSVPAREFFVENYIPLRDVQGQVVAMVEVYKEPDGVTSAIRTGQLLVWTITIVGGVLVYLALFGIVRRGNTMLRQQQLQLVEAESQLFAGEMATALAHSLRNPLSSVRNSAEVALCSDDVPMRRNAQDIITQVDFLSQWIRELLLYSRPLTGETETVDLQPVLDGLLASFATTFERQGIRVRWEREGCAGILVQGNTTLLKQALHSVVSNAVEAMPAGGELRIGVRRGSAPEGIEVTIGDTGVGMSPQQLAAAFRPFHTTKDQGLGVGLPMVRRAMERFGGSVALSSVESLGTQVRLLFRTSVLRVRAVAATGPVPGPPPPASRP